MSSVGRGRRRASLVGVYRERHRVKPGFRRNGGCPPLRSPEPVAREEMIGVGAVTGSRPRSRPHCPYCASAIVNFQCCLFSQWRLCRQKISRS